MRLGPKSRRSLLAVALCVAACALPKANKVSGGQDASAGAGGQAGGGGTATSGGGGGTTAGGGSGGQVGGGGSTTTGGGGTGGQSGFGGTGGQGGSGGTGGQGGSGGAASSPCSADAGPTKCSVKALALGHDHSCALLDDGTVRCWGSNLSGQLGVDPAQLKESVKPLAVPGLTGVTSIAAGHGHTCVVMSNAVTCWGRNAAGQLGLGYVSSYELPKPISGGLSFSKLGHARADTQCAISTSSDVYCWGANSSGEAGTGTPSSTPVPPSKVSALTGSAEVVACSGHSCARAGDVVRCWGSDAKGQMGDGAAGGNQLVPQVVPGLAASQLACGTDHTCAVAGGKILCWGVNDQCHLGIGGSATANVPTPTPIAAPGTANIASGGGWATCGALDGHAYCWGRTLNGAVGNATTADGNQCTPVQVWNILFTDKVLSMGSSWWHSCAYVDSGFLYCWGRNNMGQLGDGTMSSTGIPLPVKW